MARKVVIDHDILGWSDSHRDELLKEYEDILQVGKHPALQQRSFDATVGAFCKKNNCDLITGDIKSYSHFFEAGISAVRISQKEWWEKADKPILLVQIEK